MFIEGSLDERARWLVNSGMTDVRASQPPGQTENLLSPEETPQELSPEQIVLLGLALVCNVEQVERNGQIVTQISKGARGRRLFYEGRFSPFGEVHYNSGGVQLILKGDYPFLQDPRSLLTRQFLNGPRTDLLLLGMLAGSPGINLIQSDYGGILSDVSLAFYKEYGIPLGVIKKGQRRMHAINIADPLGVLDILQKSSVIESSELAANMLKIIILDQEPYQIVFL